MKKPTLSIILTIYNQEDIIRDVVKSIKDNISSVTKEIIVVFDACVDKSEEYTKEIFKDIKGVDVIYEYADDLYELKCNNIGLKRSTCNYSMIIQDDMFIKERDFDRRMLKPFGFSDTFAVTSRMAHNYILVPIENRYWQIVWDDRAGYEPYNKSFKPISRSEFVIRDVVNRGPLVLDNEKVQKLNYLDEIFWPENLDEHDICLRAWVGYGWVSGAYWIEWTSEEKYGSTRKDAAKYQWFEQCNRENKLKLAERHKEYLISNKKHNQSRILL